jgi:8-oxo-dGTP diphosphatase
VPRQAELNPIDVVVGVLTDDRGRVLIQQRTDGPFAGLWELPGGKIESAETAGDALRRELREELGVAVIDAGPLIRITHRYPDRVVTLNTFAVTRFEGPVHGAEGQPIKWVRREQLFDEPMLPADRPLSMAINLPDRYLVTRDPGAGASARQEAALCAGLEASLSVGVDLVCLRCPSYGDDEYERLARRVYALCRAGGARLMLHGGADRARLARQLDGAGLHLPAGAAATLTQRPIDDGRWLAVSAHTARELDRAADIGADFAVVGTLRSRTSARDAEVFDWDAFARLVEPAALPVYAGGGARSAGIARARRAGSQGIAAALP